MSLLLSLLGSTPADPPPADTFDHWSADGIDHTAVPVVQLQSNPAAPADDKPGEDTFPYWLDEGIELLAIPGSAQQTDAAAVAQDDPQTPPAWTDEATDEDWWQGLDSSPVAGADGPVEPAPVWSEDAADPWDEAIDSSPVADLVVPALPEDIWDHWLADGWDHVAIPGSALQLDAPVAPEEPGIADTFDHWLADGWESVAFPGSALQSDVAAVAQDSPSESFWPYDTDEAATLYDWMVVGEPIIEEDPQPTDVWWDEECFGDEWELSLDSSPVGVNAAAPEESGQADTFDHWLTDGFDHVAFPGSAQQSDGVVVVVDEPQPDPFWPYEIDESATLFDWMCVGEPIIEEDPVVVVPPSGVGDPYGPGWKKKRYAVQVEDQLLVFTDEADAINALALEADDPESKEAPAVEQAEAEPEEVIDLPAVKAFAETVGKADDYAESLAAKQYERLIELFEQMRDEEDIELLLLHL
jgi:hypothetical protein